MSRIRVKRRYEIKLSVENEFRGFVIHVFGLGMVVIIPNRLTPNKIRPNQTAHQSSDVFSDPKSDFIDMSITFGY